MKKHLFATVLILSLVMLSGCNQPPQPQNNPFKDAILTPIVKGCAETDKGTQTRAPTDFEEREPTITVQGNTIIYDRAIEHMCCRKTELTNEFSTGVMGEGTQLVPMTYNIKIYENWSGEGCRCECFSELGAKVENLQNGTYNVTVIEKGTNPDESTMQEKIIIQKSVTIPSAAPDLNALKIELEETQLKRGQGIGFILKNTYVEPIFLPCEIFALEKFVVEEAKWGSSFWTIGCKVMRLHEVLPQEIQDNMITMYDDGTFRFSITVYAGCKKNNLNQPVDCMDSTIIKSEEFIVEALETDIKKIQSCSKNEDCMLSRGGCCSCDSGGKKISINKAFEWDYSEQFLVTCVYRTGSCPIVDKKDEDPSCYDTALPACENGKCTIKFGIL